MKDGATIGPACKRCHKVTIRYGDFNRSLGGYCSRCARHLIEYLDEASVTAAFARFDAYQAECKEIDRLYDLTRTR